MFSDGHLGLIPDAVIAWIVAAYTGSGVVGFILTMLGLQGVYFVIWIKNSLWSWLVYWVAGRRKMTAFSEDYLVKNRFPPPPEFVNDMDEYLEQVVRSEQYDCSTRVEAAIATGVFVGLTLAGRIQLGLQLQWAFQSALKRYAKRFPPSPRNDE